MVVPYWRCSRRPASTKHVTKHCHPLTHRHKCTVLLIAANRPMHRRQPTESNAPSTSAPHPYIHQAACRLRLSTLSPHAHAHISHQTHRLSPPARPSTAVRHASTYNNTCKPRACPHAAPSTILQLTAIHACADTHAHVCVCVCVHAHMCVCVCVCVFLCVHPLMCMHETDSARFVVLVPDQPASQTYIHTHTYICIYTHTHTHTHTCMHVALCTRHHIPAVIKHSIHEHTPSVHRYPNACTGIHLEHTRTSSVLPTHEQHVIVSDMHTQTHC